ncbi:MAG: FISUMP domain-containing protein [Vicingaceae bacterium]|nr:FISUMP domain-containing protein [Vicingaceae bacterium]
MKNFNLLSLIILICPSFIAQTITDADGNVYNTITIGNQLWMNENLKTTKYSDGTIIPNITSSSVWGNLDSGAYCDYNNDPNISAIYGKLYNWYAATDSNNICPTGWHVPTDSDWNKLIFHLDPGADTTATGTQSLSVGGKLKEIDTTHWSNPNTGAINSTGFTALPGGYRMIIGSYDWINYHGFWWSSTEFSVDRAWYRSLVYNSNGISRFDHWKNNGFSIRCVCDQLVNINELEKSDNIKVYPNPTTKILVVEGFKKENTIEIINLQGQIVKTEFVKDSKIIIDISDLSTGVYVIKIKSDSEIIMKKLIKQ